MVLTTVQNKGIFQTFNSGASVARQAEPDVYSLGYRSPYTHRTPCMATILQLRGHAALLNNVHLFLTKYPSCSALLGLISMAYVAVRQK